MGRRLLLALGGNAILPAGGSGTIDEQRRITRDTLDQIADQIGDDDRVVISHGNGPIVGNILIRNAAVSDRIAPMPLDVCDADSQGGVGYMIVQCLRNALVRVGCDRPVTAIITRVRVEETDPAFQNPTKPIGPFYPEAEAQRLAGDLGWTVVDDAGRGWRRVVPSPLPQDILEIGAIRTLLEAGHIVVAAGGGGIPVSVDADGREWGVEAVIDKDRASASLAVALKMEDLVIVTGVTHVALSFGRPEQRNIDRLTVAEARKHMDAGEFGVGSMKPKIESALHFLEGGGREVLITSPEELGPALAGRTGTRIAA